MNHNLDDKPCPRCKSSGWLVYARDAREIRCQKCHARFKATLPALPEPPTPVPIPPIPPRFGSSPILDYFSQVDEGGNIHRTLVSSYFVTDEHTIPREFDPHNNRTAFVLYLLAAKAKNRRRYNKDIIKRNRKQLIQKLELSEITD